jgi:simple sugar transport system permease protein
MLNYVAIAWVELMVYGPWKGADGFPYTALFAPGWHLPLLFKRAHAGLLLVVVLAGVLWFVERRTALGYEVRVAGASPATARYGGLPVLSRLLMVMAAAGGCAGLAGACELAGLEHRLHAGISPGYGYTAIIIAFLARRSLPVAVGVAFLFAALAVGGDSVQVAFPGVSASVVQVFLGLLLLLVLAGGTLTRLRLRWR